MRDHLEINQVFDGEVPLDNIIEEVKKTIRKLVPEFCSEEEIHEGVYSISYNFKPPVVEGYAIAWNLFHADDMQDGVRRFMIQCWMEVLYQIIIHYAKP